MGVIESPLEEARPAVDARTPPQVFTRTFITPAGMPWDQAKAAQLDARHGAPLPLADLAHRIKRLSSWAPGQPGRYAVFYVRRRDITGPFETELEVDGSAHRVTFGSTGPDLRRYWSSGLVAIVISSGLVALAATIFLAVTTRANAEQALAALEQRTAGKLRLAQRVADERERTRDLARAQGAGVLPGDVLAEVAWVQRAKVPEARIVAFHWDRGVIVVEARGATPPVHTLERRLVRGDNPVRPGVWLWGVEPMAGVAGGPVAAEPGA